MPAARQRPSSELFAPVPAGIQEPFWYASLQSFWLFYRVDPELLREKLPGEGLEVALFDFADGEPSGLVSLDLQRYTGHGPTYLETTDEVEFNVYVYPQARVPDVPLMTWQQYLLGDDQTKSIGGYRLHVPCDNAIAVKAGQGLYNEPKYLAVFDCTVPSLNGPPFPPGTTWSYSVYQPAASGQEKGPLIFGLECDLGGAPSVPANPSPLIEYGVLKNHRVVANFWDFYGPFTTYFAADAGRPWSADITFGDKRDTTGTLADLELLIGDARPIAAQVFTSQPVSAESRGWYLTPGSEEQPQPLDAFVALSAALTGFRAEELWGTGQAESYLDELLATVDEAIVARLLARGGEALRSSDPQAALRREVMEDPDLGPVARNAIILWYLGQWNALPNEWRNRNGASPRDVPHVVSADAYSAGLAWKAFGAHPMGANPTGFGSWATPPARNAQR